MRGLAGSHDDLGGEWYLKDHTPFFLFIKIQLKGWDWGGNIS